MRPEDIIKSIPEEEIDWEKDTGSVRIRFMRLTPIFKIIDKKVPLSFLFSTLHNIEKDANDCGMCIKLSSNNLSIKNYYNFVTSLFKNQKVEIIDNQRNAPTGTPDFEIKTEENLSFHIEYKSKNDSIRPLQLQWIGNHQEQEVWFLIFEDLEFYIESEEITRERIKVINDKNMMANLVSNSILEQFNNKLQNQQTKITEKQD